MSGSQTNRMSSTSRCSVNDAVSKKHDSKVDISALTRQKKATYDELINK